MIDALSELQVTPDISDPSLDERLGLMVDREPTKREGACLEDIDYRSPRDLDKALIL